MRELPLEYIKEFLKKKILIKLLEVSLNPLETPGEIPEEPLGRSQKRLLQTTMLQKSSKKLLNEYLKKLLEKKTLKKTPSKIYEKSA